MTITRVSGIDDRTSFIEHTYISTDMEPGDALTTIARLAEIISAGAYHNARAIIAGSVPRAARGHTLLIQHAVSVIRVVTSCTGVAALAGPSGGALANNHTGLIFAGAVSAAGIVLTSHDTCLICYTS